MSVFKPGDRVEVIATNGPYRIGQQGMVKSTALDLVFVELDEQLALANGAILAHYVDDEARITTLFRPGELRHVVTPTP